jgi:hypothetical protein
MVAIVPPGVDLAALDPEAYASSTGSTTEGLTVAMRRALEQAMGHEPDSGTVQRLQEGGLTLLSEDTMSKAIHDVYCGIMADHEHPNEKDLDQARALIAAVQRNAS